MANGLLNDFISIAGFEVDSHGIFSSKRDAWQRNFGYFTLYDWASPAALMYIDCEPVLFHYKDKNWKIEFWKGRYGGFIGAEVGVYTGSFQIGNATVDHYMEPLWGTDTQVADAKDWLQISFTLKRNGRVLFTRDSGVRGHWWLTGFKLGAIRSRDELVNEITIVFKDVDILNAFVGGLTSDRLRYTSNEFTTDSQNLSVTVIFDRPHSSQDNIMGKHSPAIEQIVNYLSRVYGDILNKYRIDEFANFLFTAYTPSLGDIAKAFFYFRYPFNDVIRYLLTRSSDLGFIASILRAAGYSIVDIGNYFINALFKTAEEVAKVFKAAQYTANEVGTFLKDKLGLARDKVAEFMKKAGYSANQVGNFFNDVKHYSEETTAKLLASAGYSINQIGTFFKDELNKHAYDVMVLLYKAEFSFSAIAAFMTAAYDLTAQEITGLWANLMSLIP